ncbi:MAG: hypothetical protein DMF61_06235 [Blastocatellia bacterium AA13]|nr:MAG: hypothetical protein DMF61_06235 [Blastocatellia bacterium AA13]
MDFGLHARRARSYGDGSTFFGPGAFLSERAQPNLAHLTCTGTSDLKNQGGSKRDNIATASAVI